MDTKLSIAMLLLCCAFAEAQELPIADLAFNPKYQVQIVNLRVAPNQGFTLSATAKDYAIEIKGTPMKSEAAANQKSMVEMANIKNLYSTRGSPYPGQISDVITCEKAFKAQPASFQIAGQQAMAIIGGTNARKLFGSCNHDQIAYWGEYFTFYDRKGSRQIDVRVFRKFEKPRPDQVKKLSEALRGFSSGLFVERRT